MWTLDPFTPRLNFTKTVGMRIRTTTERSKIREFRPIEIHVDGFLDIEKLEALANFEGLLRMPREQSEHDYPTDLEEQMKICEPQFILRSLGRVVREGGPDEPLPLESAPSERDLVTAALDEVRRLETEPLDLIDQMTYEAVAEHRGWMKWLYDDVRWERHFSREIKEDFAGPLWRYDPDAPKESDDDEESPSE